MKGLNKQIYFGLALVFFAHMISRILLQFHIWIGLISGMYLSAYLVSTDLSLKIIGVLWVFISLKNQKTKEKRLGQE